MEICVLHWAEIEHLIATIFQPGGWSEISAQADTHDLIRSLGDAYFHQRLACVAGTRRGDWGERGGSFLFFPFKSLNLLRSIQ